MQKIYIFFLGFVLVILISTLALSQTIIFDDKFDNYIVDQQLACQNPVDWTTWTFNPCNVTEDPRISNQYAFSGTKSVWIEQNRDLVKLYGGLTNGISIIDFKIIIPNNKAGYFNVLSGFSPNANDWAMECNFDRNRTGRLNAGGANAKTFTYTQNSWHSVQVVIDIDIDSAYFWFDEVKLHSWQWTKGWNGVSGHALRLDATNFFGATTNDKMFVDDFEFTYYPKITSTTTGGDWNLPDTWASGVVPVTGNPVEIINGATVNLSSNLIRNTRTIVSGTLNCGENIISGVGNFILSSGATLGIGSALGINSSGNSGNIQVTGTRLFNSAANFIYNGSGPQVTGSGLPQTANNLTVNNSSGVTLSDSNSVAGTLTMISGNIITGANTLTLGTSTIVLGNLSYSSGTIIGNFKRWLSASTVSDVLFPIGTGNNYRPANISFTQAPAIGGTLTTFFTATNPGSIGLPLDDNGSEIINAGMDGYWTINANALTGGTYSIDLTADGFTGVADFSALRILKRTAGGSWTLQGNHSVGTGSNTIPVLHRTGLTGFSEFGIGGTVDNPLPVELTSFTAVTKGNNILLNWQTATEINNYGFEVERTLTRPSPDVGEGGEAGRGWEKIGFVNGNGNSNSPKQYSFTDNNPIGGSKFNYRLKQIDNDGQFEYSNIIEVEIFPGRFELFQNYPNPFNPSTIIKYTVVVDANSAPTTPVKLIIYDALGNEVAIVVNEEKSAGSYEVDFDSFTVVGGLSSGVYFYQLQAGSFIQTRKMILLQ